MQVWCTSQLVWYLRVTLNSPWVQQPNSEEIDKGEFNRAAEEQQQEEEEEWGWWESCGKKFKDSDKHSL